MVQTVRQAILENFFKRKFAGKSGATKGSLTPLEIPRVHRYSYQLTNGISFKIIALFTRSKSHEKIL